MLDAFWHLLKPSGSGGAGDGGKLMENVDVAATSDNAVGPMEAKLHSFGTVRGLVFGAWRGALLTCMDCWRR